MVQSKLTHKKVLFSLCSDESKASSRVRGYWITDELEKLNCQIYRCPQKSRISLVKLLLLTLRVDTIIFQKTYGRYHLWILKLSKILGKKSFIDIDDAPSRENSPKTLNRFRTMLQQADGVFAGSPNLVDYSKDWNSNVHLIATAIKLENYKMKRHERKASRSNITLGWIGNGIYYANDLVSVLKEPIKKLCEKHKITLKIVGTSGESSIQAEFKSIPKLNLICIDSIDWANPQSVLNEILSFDIGLYPLLQTDFNSYKCGFKALEYMACGLPVISSDVAMNKSIVLHNETGMLANTDDEWYSVIEELILNPDKRVSLGNAGRKLVESTYNTKIVAEQILAALETPRECE